MNEICSPTQVVSTPFSLAGVDTNELLVTHPASGDMMTIICQYSYGYKIMIVLNITRASVQVARMICYEIDIYVTPA